MPPFAGVLGVLIAMVAMVQVADAFFCFSAFALALLGFLRRDETDAAAIEPLSFGKSREGTVCREFLSLLVGPNSSKEH